jgi:PAS domain S-box-containing protein
MDKIYWSLLILAIALILFIVWLQMIRRYHRVRRKAEQVLLNLASVVQSSEDAIYGKSRDGILTSWNRGAERLFGYVADEIVGRPELELIPVTRRKEMAGLAERLSRGETIEQHEIQFQRKDGTLVDVSLNVSPIFTGQVVVGSSTVARDITRVRAFSLQREEYAKALEKSNQQLARRELIMRSLLEDLHASKKKLEDQKRSLQEANARLESLNRLKDEFVSMASHELRTPLTAIREGISLVYDRVLGPINGEQEEFLRAVDQNIDRLTELINNILDLSKIEAGRLAFSKRRLSLVEIVRSVVENYRMRGGGRRIVADLGSVPDVFADPNRVTQVIWNLLSNAVKFTADDGAITFSVEKRDSMVAVSVEDNGIGIASEDMPKLFQKFSQVGPQFPRGTGLGLALCKQIVELQGGTISVRSVPGRGSTFTFTLPVYETFAAMEQHFAEQLETARRAGRDFCGLLVWDAWSIPGAAGSGSGGRVALEERADRVRQIVYPSDAVLSVEPRWIAVIGSVDARGFRAMQRRLWTALSGRPFSPGEGQEPAGFGTAFYPQDAADVQGLFSKAVQAASVTGVGNHV